jgi:predicted secreted protein
MTGNGPGVWISRASDGMLGAEEETMMKRTASVLALCVGLAVLTLPAWAKKKVGPEGVWDPGWSQITDLKAKCASTDPAKAKACFIGAMKGDGANKEAMEFTAQLPEPGFMRSYADGGPAGIAYVTFPYRANENQAVYLVNGKPESLNVDDQSLLPLAELEKDPTYAALKARGSSAALFPGDRYTPGHPAISPSPGGGVRFLVDYRIANGCRACEELGTALFAFDFDETGKFKGASVASVEDARNVQRKIEASAGLEFNIRLKADQATGYRWVVTQTPDESVVKFAWKLYNTPDPQVPGSSGEEIWGFKAVAKGKTTIVLTSVDPAQAGTEKSQTARYEITVK